MRLGVTIAMLIGAALFVPAPLHAQAPDVPPSSASAPVSQADQATPQTAASKAAGASFSAQTTGPSSGAQAIVPLAPRTGYTEHATAPQGAVSK
jgi:hypothetical protein